MARINQNFRKLPGGYLFPEIGRRVRAFSAQNPPLPLIRLGIGDVTQPLAPVVVDAMVKASREMRSGTLSPAGRLGKKPFSAVQGRYTRFVHLSPSKSPARPAMALVST